ncbi:MAG: SH3 domain-containing protein [Cyanobacteria bacterium SBLK]|nr:SH3 domain-containing protein [Cyanobacteria bacterium SBLK]
MKNGDRVTITRKVIGGDYLAKFNQIRYDWYYVTTEDGKKGYVAADYVLVEEES